ncbi:NAD(P)H-hydrate dehydratase [Pseudonocardia bannensis]|uniref:ADP-dependent (S)-NAD(P)H-hydrate dehydratase n=1 Tax=Pseudonocardia bannensis TaxID=630973 RepID=A0A848DCR6_9PSEU|nr:NAD(P)H-hydrate dehydratase [Pseudonocardia bannensis]NMH90372.1 NAD(P)H-hydrate dehydratase [Pseudonocardia bannensis]
MSTPIPPDRRVVTPAFLRGWPLPEPERGDKSARGTVLVVGGSRGTPGALLLAGVGALRVGAGVLQLAGPESVATAVGINVPEALALSVPETDKGSVSDTAVDFLSDLLGSAQAVLIGPGLFGVEETQRLVARLVEKVGQEAMVVLDAYALRGLRPETVAPVAGRVVLTPNVAEAAALLERDRHELDDLAEAARSAAAKYDAVVSLFGHIADPDGRLWVDESGHIGLGTSGSGDVLSGLVAGLLARGASPAQAACWGAHVHTTAGERLGARITQLGFLAREILDEAPLVLDELQP